MATYDSKYYYNKYKEKKSEVRKYEDSIKTLQTIRTALADNLHDEIRNVNKELDELVADLKRGVRHNAVFTDRANSFDSKKEKAATADSNLSVSIREIDEEIRSLTTKKNQAIQARDDNKQRCKEKLEEEGKPSWYYWF